VPCSQLTRTDSLEYTRTDSLEYTQVATHTCRALCLLLHHTAPVPLPWAPPDAPAGPPASPEGKVQAAAAAAAAAAVVGREGAAEVVLVWGCGALAGLAGNPVGQRAAVEAGALASLVRVPIPRPPTHT
jgi:hypothetical protein